MSNTVDEKTGTITYEGFSVISKGDHSHMPSRDSSYLSTDERGHIQASSMSGSNDKTNVVPQAADLNHGGYSSMEQGERDALKSGAEIYSVKIASASNQPGHRPDAFMVNDQITYKSGNVESVHLSFSNLTNAEQEGINREAMEQASDLLEGQPNPGDHLRASMSVEEYSDLMEKTDAELPDIRENYKETGDITKMAEIRSDMVSTAKSNTTGSKTSVNVGKSNSGASNLSTGKGTEGVSTGGISVGKSGTTGGKSGNSGCNGGQGNGGTGGGISGGGQGNGTGEGGGHGGGGHGGNGGGHGGGGHGGH